MHPLQTILDQQKQGVPCGIYSCCSANDFVLRATFARARRYHTPVLIEATANQVNQFGGYTGMQPLDFYRHVTALAADCDFPQELLILGGDHLGPLTWAALPEAEAMANAEKLVELFVLAGFTKIHLDTSMRLGDDSRTARLSDAVIARRGARLCKVAETAYAARRLTCPQAEPPVYVIGSEVPIPGGTQESEGSVSVTLPADCEATYSAFRAAFMAEGLTEAWERVIGLVVQPGVEFGDGDVFAYDHDKAAALTACVRTLPLVFEGHSTDYQTPSCLRAMVEDGIAILKVGPALTFALREGLFALEHMEKEMFRGTGIAMSDFRNVLEHTMLQSDDNWRKHYHGDGNATRYARAYSFSDRARYYLPQPAVDAAIKRLLQNLAGGNLPLSLISQYMPMQYPRVRDALVENAPVALLLDRIGDCIDEYYYATLLPHWDAAHQA